MVPVELAAATLVTPVLLMLTTCPVGSNAKFCGALTALAAVVQVDWSSSATNASFTDLPTNSGNSSEKNRKSTDRQFLPLGTVKSTFRIVTSRSVPPRTAAPPSDPPALGVTFGSSASVASPLVRMP